MEAKMQEVVTKFNFGKVEKNNFKYCGRQIVKDGKGVHVTCPNLIDRVRPIHLGVAERKNKNGQITEPYRQQLRSVATKDVGLHMPLKAFKFEEAVIIGLQDASFANDVETNKLGQRSGFRSQSGRLVCLAGPTFKKDKTGPLLLLDWHSTTIKRVCRSTLQAETMSLLSGMEECEHLRMMLHGLRREHHRFDKTWQTEAMDNINVELYTDCRSLDEYVNQPGLHSVSDKRLAIDLTGIRQQIWRRQQEETGDPLITDRLPLDASTRLHWVNTEKMAADCLTKSMRPKSLTAVMSGQWISLTPEKHNGCENKGDSASVV